MSLSLLVKYSNIFAFPGEPLGQNSKIHHNINTGDKPPIRQRFRRLPPTFKEEVRTLIRDMLDKDVIKPSSSPWASPIVLIKNKDGSTRFSVDYHKLNGLTHKDAYTLPRIDETLDTLSG